MVPTHPASPTEGGGEPFPISVDLVRSEQALQIVWDDGHTSVYQAAALRWACPCAQCRGEMGLPGRLDQVSELPAVETEIIDVGLVGTYALQIAFASGHSTGIYTFRHLRQMCRCAQCRASTGS